MTKMWCMIAGYKKRLNKRYGKVVRLLMVLTVILIISTLLYFGLSINSTKTINDLERPYSNTISGTAQLQSAPEDWSTYDNTTLGYSIKYPPDWNVVDLNTPNILIHTPDLKYGGVDIEKGAEIWINHLRIPENNTFTDFIESEKERLEPVSSSEIIDKKGGQLVIQLTQYDKIKAIFIQQSDTQFFRFDLIYSESSRQEEFEHILNTIVSSFQLFQP